MRSFLSDAIILATLTALSYFYVYCFESGYSLHFDYPSDLFPITVSIIISTWWLVTLYVTLVIFSLPLALYYWPDTPKHFYGLIFAVFVYLFVIVTVLAFSTTIILELTPTLTVSSAIVIGYLGVYLYRRHIIKLQKTSEENLADAGSKDEEIKRAFTILDAKSELLKYSLGYLMIKRFGFDPLAIALIILVLIPGISTYAGFAEAYSKRRFYIYNGEDGRTNIVIRVRDGLVLSAPYDEKSSSYYRSFTIKDATDQSIQGLTPIIVDALHSRPLDTTDSQQGVAGENEGERRGAGRGRKLPPPRETLGRG